MLRSNSIETTEEFHSEISTNMNIPSKQKKCVIVGQGKELDELHFIEGPIPEVDEHGVLVKLHAAALNYRDLLIPRVSQKLITILSFV
jgi:hypothetical protein